MTLCSEDDQDHGRPDSAASHGSSVSVPAISVIGRDRSHRSRRHDTVTNRWHHWHWWSHSHCNVSEEDQDQNTVTGGKREIETVGAMQQLLVSMKRLKEVGCLALKSITWNKHQLPVLSSLPKWSIFVAAGVPKSSHFGIFGLLKHKLGLGGRSRHVSREEGSSSVSVVDDAVTGGYLSEGVLESPQVVRIRCGERQESRDASMSPVIVRRKVRT